MASVVDTVINITHETTNLTLVWNRVSYGLDLLALRRFLRSQKPGCIFPAQADRG